MDALFALRNVIVCQGDRFRLTVDLLDFEAQRVYVLTGPNGAGKSTLLKTMAALQTPQSGTITYKGLPVDTKKSNLIEYRRRVTLVDQSPYLLRGTVMQNIAFGLKVRRISGALQTKRAQQALDMVGLSGFESHQAHELSGGEAKRVGLARALALQPEVLLLDEPTANTDKASLAAIESLISELPEKNISVILSSHDLFQSRRLSAEVIRLENGKLLNTSRDIETTNRHPMEESSCQSILKVQEI